MILPSIGVAEMLQVVQPQVLAGPQSGQHAQLLLGTCQHVGELVVLRLAASFAIGGHAVRVCQLHLNGMLKRRQAEARVWELLSLICLAQSDES